MCFFLPIITEINRLFFLIVAEVYDTLSRMGGRMWGETVGLIVIFVIGGAGLLLEDAFFSMDISQIPLPRFISPSSMSLFFFIAYNFFPLEVLCNCHRTIDLGILEMRCAKSERPWPFGLVLITCMIEAIALGVSPRSNCCLLIRKRVQKNAQDW